MRIFAIIQKESIHLLRKKKFWSFLFLFPLLAVLCLTGILAIQRSSQPTYNVLVYAEDEETKNFLEQMRFKNNPKLKIKFFYTTEFLSKEALRKSPYNIQLYIDPEVLLNLQTSPQSSATIPVLSTESLYPAAYHYIKNELETKFERLKLRYFERKIGQKGLMETFDQLKVRLQLDFIEDPDFETQQWEEDQKNIGIGLSILLILLVYLFVLEFQQNVQAEKEGKVLELLFSSVSIRTWAWGKTIGIGLLSGLRSLGMFGLGIVYWELLHPQHYNALLAPAEQTALTGLQELLYQEVNWVVIIPFFALCLLLSYGFYGLLTAAISLRLRAVGYTAWLSLMIISPLLLALLLNAHWLGNNHHSILQLGSYLAPTASIFLLFQLIYGLSSSWLITGLISYSLVIFGMQYGFFRKPMFG